MKHLAVRAKLVREAPPEFKIEVFFRPEGTMCLLYIGEEAYHIFRSLADVADFIAANYEP